MHPVLIRVGPFTLYAYGVMVAAGFGIVAYLAGRRAASFGFTRSEIIDLSILMLVAGLFGARVAYVAMHSAYYVQRPFEILLLHHGGLVFYGGFLAAVTAAVIYTRVRRVSFWKIADLFSPFIALAHAVGRIGCFLNGCCYGAAVSCFFPLAVFFPGDTVYRHPVQVYSSVGLIGLFLFLRWRQDRRRFDGEVFLLYCVLYSLLRFLVEFLRGDNPLFMIGLTFSQAVSLAVFGVTCTILMVIRKRCARSSLR